MSTDAFATSSSRVGIRECFIAAMPAHVYRAFAERDELERWFVSGAEIELRPGGVYNLTWGPGQRVEGMVVSADAPRRFVWDETWVGGPGVTRVSVEFEPADGGTRLRLLHAGFGDGAAWDEQLASVERGWATELEHLRSYLEDSRVKQWPAKEECA